MPIQSLTPAPSTLDIQWARVFKTEGESYAERAQAALIVILKLIIGDFTSIILVDLGSVNLQFWASLEAQVVNNPPAMQETWVQFLSSIPGKIPWRRAWQPTPVFFSSVQSLSHVRLFATP